jgi:hypothetical protein
VSPSLALIPGHCRPCIYIYLGLAARSTLAFRCATQRTGRAHRRRRDRSTMMRRTRSAFTCNWPGVGAGKKVEKAQSESTPFCLTFLPLALAFCTGGATCDIVTCLTKRAASDARLPINLKRASLVADVLVSGESECTQVMVHRHTFQRQRALCTGRRQTGRRVASRDLIDLTDIRNVFADTSGRRLVRREVPGSRIHLSRAR